MKVTLKKRAFVVTMIMLMLTSIALTSSTFAWFTMADATDVEAMNLTVQSIDGIQISANASTWTASLEGEDFFGEGFRDDDAYVPDHFAAYENNNNIYPDVLTPVSSAFENATNGFADFFKAPISGGSTTADIRAITQDKENPEGFIAFDIFFKVDNENPDAVQKIYFNTSTFEDVNAEDGTDQNALSALRVAFTPLGTVTDPSSSTAVTDAIAKKDFVAGNTVSYEVDSLTRSAGATAYGIAAGVQATKYLNSTGTGVAVSNGVLNAGGNISGTSVTDQSVDTDKYFELPVGISKVRVYIWMEGQDVDCLNSIAGSSLVADLRFTIE
ncbi:MAG: hypothetical protein IJZ88_04760 [Clostridia bacterium]|nr:hypothetical protein [Clostridia bacterium]